MAASSSTVKNTYEEDIEYPDEQDKDKDQPILGKLDLSEFTPDEDLARSLKAKLAQLEEKEKRERKASREKKSSSRKPKPKEGGRDLKVLMWGTAVLAMAVGAITIAIIRNKS